MERRVWTDERLDDMVARNDSLFERILGEIAGLRVEMRDMRTELHTEMRDMRTELHTEMRDMRTELHDSRRDMFHGMLPIFGSLIAICAALIAHAL